jgi:hypothetical protein
LARSNAVASKKSAPLAATTNDGLYQITGTDDYGRPFCAGMIVEHGEITYCAPILRWMWHGSSLVAAKWKMAFMGHRLHLVEPASAGSRGARGLREVTPA